LGVRILFDHVEQNGRGLVVVLELEEHLGIDHPPHGEGRIDGSGLPELVGDGAHPLLHVRELGACVLEFAGLDTRRRQQGGHKREDTRKHARQNARRRRGACPALVRRWVPVGSFIG
jgi:hypothetical protein